MEKLSYFYGKEADQFAFFTVPKILFKDPEYKELPCEAKMLYGMMLDRMSLSIENQWFDEQRRAFIRVSEDFVMENLGCGRNKALNLMKQLEDFGLIERKKLGQGKSSIIYVKKFIRQEAVNETGYAKEQTTAVQQMREEEPETILSDRQDDRIVADTENGVDSEKSGNQISGQNTGYSEVYFSNNRKFKNQTSRSLEIKHQEVYFSNPNNTDMNNPDINNTKSNHISSAGEMAGTGRMMRCDDDVNDKLRGYSALIRENIDVESLKIAYPYDQELIEGIYDLILETVMCESDKILISSNMYPAELVRSKFLKLRYDHVTYALDCLKSNTTKVKNIKKYLLAVLFNARSTMDGYYQAEVNHDMPQFAG